MNAHHIFLSFLSLSTVNSLPLSPLPSSMFLSFTLTASPHPESYSPFLFISVSSFLHCAPSSSLILTHSVYEESKKQSAAFRPQSYSISLTPSRTSPCFSLRVQKMCKNTFSITDLERILAWWDPHEPDLSKLTLYTEFTALINQNFNLWLYVFSLASQIM